jgi:predicted transcriptional regulator of viral defense system
MKFYNLLDKVENEPVFTSSLLMTPGEDAEDIYKQLTRWQKGGRIIQLRRGLYALAKPYRKIEPTPFLVANALKPASYVSLQSALEYHGMIPEYVPEVTSITTERPEVLETPLGRFRYRHVKKSLLFGYQKMKTALGQEAFVAEPEKSLLDLIYLTPGSDSRPYLEELRLQNFEALDENKLLETAQRMNSQKVKKATRLVIQLMKEEEVVQL